MKSIISTSFILILFFFFGCSKDDNTTSLSTNLPKLKNIVHISPRDTVHESFYYNEEGILQIIENFQGRPHYGIHILEYSNKRLGRYGSNYISYNSLGQIQNIQYFINYNNPERLLISTKKYQYYSDGKISGIKQFYSDEYLALIPQDERPSNEEEEFLYYWENNNIKKMEYHLNGAFYSEHTYKYDNSINYKVSFPISLKIGAELSENNVISTSTRFANGGIDPICFKCPSILEYDEQGRVFKITEPNEGFGGPYPEIKIITYKD
ncbi:hypothetical protein [Ascidiimonas sp. W6]|uniref:hypothetical protein n=1 Tax=Ascidiimonas meishanensis TaxID=3128903 RepID=UPI0030EE969C